MYDDVNVDLTDVDSKIAVTVRRITVVANLPRCVRQVALSTCAIRGPKSHHVSAYQICQGVRSMHSLTCTLFKALGGGGKGHDTIDPRPTAAWPNEKLVNS